MRHMTHDYRHLGETVRQRRIELGLTQTEFATKARLGLKTIQRIEGGREQRTLSPTTLHGIDTAAEWQPGSASRVLRGEAPAETGRHSNAATIESSALLVWTAQRTGDADAIESTYQRLSERLSQDELRAVTQRVTELGH